MSDNNHSDKLSLGPITLKLGTRGSKLALTQAGMVKHALEASHDNLHVEIIPIKSNADWKKSDPETPLSEEAGGKGMFASEIEDCLMAGEIDFGVHSMKDMASHLPDGLALDHVMPREAPQDVLISQKYKSVHDLPKGCVVGTCSTRRAALLLSHNPDLEIVPFRGNVGTRLEKLKAGQVDVTLLARAGLNRLGIDTDMAHDIGLDDMLPACGQGIVCMETREGDDKTRNFLSAIHCTQTGFAAIAERAVLQILDGSCHTPISAYACQTADGFLLRALVASLNGQIIFRHEATREVTSDIDAYALGQEVGQALKAQLPDGFLE